MRLIKPFLVTIFSFTVIITEAQRSLLDSIINIFQTRSIYKNDVNWDTTKELLYENINHSEADSVKAIIPAYTKLAEILHITHGEIDYNGIGYGAMNKEYGNMNKRISKTVGMAAQNNRYCFRTEILEDKYAYLSIPSISIADTISDMNRIKKALNQQAQIIQDSLYKLDIPHLKGVIIDLRLCGGGSIPIILGGLSSLLDDGNIFSFVMADNTRQKIIKDKEYLLFDKDTLVNLPSKCSSLNKIKLAVLISPYTVSAGEQTAIALEGKTYTTFIGERTRGMTTGIETIQLRKNLTLDCAEGYSIDRNGKVYSDGVIPNIEIIGGDDFDNLQNDKKIQAALNWFANKNN